MAGERKALLTIGFSSFKHNDWIKIWFKDHYEYFQADNTPPYPPENFPTSANGNDIPLILQNFHDFVKTRIFDLGWLSEFNLTQSLSGPEIAIPHGYLTIEATTFGNINNFIGTQFGLSNGSNVFIAQYLENISPIIVTATTSFITCGGSSTGNINLTVINAVGAVTYQWSNGSVTNLPSLNNIPAGTYSVTVIDSQGTSTILNNIIVSGNARIEILGTINGRDINIDVTGGVAPYTFKWVDGPTTQNRTNLNTGSYAITVTDSNGCQRAGSFLVKNEWFSFSQNPVPVSLSAANYNTKPNLSFICEVWIEKVYLSNSYELVYTAEQPADIYGKTTFYIEEILDAYVQPHFPSFSQKTVFKAINAFKRYQVKYREKYGTPPVPDAISTQTVKYVVLGGLDFEELATKTFFSSYLTYQKPFFTWQPVNKKVVPDQPEYLYFMPLDFGTTAFTVKARLYFPQGAAETFTLFSQAGSKQFELWCIPAGFDLLSLQAKAGEREVLRYEIWVEDTVSGSRVSEARSFILDKSYFRHKRYFIYVNSIGGIDTLLASGAASMNLTVESETVAKNLIPNYVATDGDLEVVSRGGRPFLALSTGYHLNRQERVALQDFRFSENIKLLSSDRYLSGRPVFKDTGVDDEFADTKALDFEFHLAYRSHYTGNLKRSGYAIPVEEVPIPIGNGGNDL